MHKLNPFEVVPPGIFQSSIIPIPPKWQKTYGYLRIALYVIIVIVTVIFALRVFFPTIEQSFNFRTPSSSRNNIVDPRSPAGSPRTNGRIEKDGTLIANTSVAGDFSTARTSLSLENNSEVPEKLYFSLRRAYRSFLYPTGTPVNTFPSEVTFIIDSTYYALRNGTLYPFVSEKAFLSRFPKENALPMENQILSQYPISEEWLGFRPGSLISNATGVFIVPNEQEVRPIGSAEIFLWLGYNFDDVIPASEEEIGIYKRGRIFLLGQPHPDGTLFLDRDTQTHYLIDNGTKRPLGGAYRDFLLKDKHPILASNEAGNEKVECVLEPAGFSGRTFACSTLLDPLKDNPGFDYELKIQNDASVQNEIDINTLTVAFETAKKKENMLTLLSQIKQRLLSRFGYGNTQ